MYAMVGISVKEFDSNITDDVSFMGLLLEEENVVVLPGQAFGLVGLSASDLSNDYQYVFRVVFCAPEEVLQEAAGRILAFCSRHAARE